MELYLSQVPYLPLEDEADSTRHGAHFFRNVKQLQVGFGSNVFRVDRQGMWAGAERFADAPWSVDWEGNMTATSLDLSAYLEVGEALSDVQASVGDLSDINTDLGYIVAGTVVGIEVIGGLIRTSTTGARIEIDGTTDSIESWDSSNNLRMALDQEDLIFYDASEVESGRISAPDGTSVTLFVEGKQFLILDTDLASSSAGIVFRNGGTQKAICTANGFQFNDDVELNDNDLNGVGNINPDNSGSDIGNATTYFDNLYIHDIYDLYTIHDTVSFDGNIVPEGGAEDIGVLGNPWDSCWADDFYGIYNAPSDRRLKTDIQEIASALEDLKKLKPVSFKYKPKQYKEEKPIHPRVNQEKELKKQEEKRKLKQERNERRANETHYGFIAQEVAKVLPDLIQENGKKKMLSLKYDEVVPLLVRAVQELNAEVEALRDNQ